MKFFENNPAIHQAIIDNDIEKVRELSNNTDRNAWGYLPYEMAVLLGRDECLRILAPHPQKRFYLFHRNQREILSAVEFHKEFHVRSVPTLAFPDYRTFQRAVGSCSKFFRDDPDGEVFRLLGNKYRRHFFLGWFAPVTIRWIDDQLRYGLFAAENLAAGSFVGEYAGLVRQINRFKPDLNEYCIRYPILWPLFRYYVVDSQSSGNESRFINHSDFPNLSPKVMVDRSLLHTGFFASRPIKKGEQLTFDYGRDFWRSRKKIIDR